MDKLVTQVNEEDEKKRLAAGGASAPKAVPEKKQKQHSCWWRIFCCCCLCCCKSSEQEEKPKVEALHPQDVKQHEPTPTQQESATPPTPEPGPTEPPSQEPKWLLDPQTEEDRKVNKKTLVLDLDETLVHSSFTYIPDADFIIEIELDGAIYKVYVRKRPGVDEFMKAVAKKFEVVIFTASLAKYADPLLDILDKDRVVSKRLFREACVQHYGNYVKDLSLLGRKMENSIIIDNSPFSYMFQPDNAIPITSWFNDKADRQLYELLPFLDSLVDIEDVSTVLSQRTA